MASIKDCLQENSPTTEELMEMLFAMDRPDYVKGEVAQLVFGWRPHHVFDREK